MGYSALMGAHLYMQVTASSVLICIHMCVQGLHTVLYCRVSFYTAGMAEISINIVLTPLFSKTCRSECMLSENQGVHNFDAG